MTYEGDKSVSCRLADKISIPFFFAFGMLLAYAECGTPRRRAERPDRWGGDRETNRIEIKSQKHIRPLADRVLVKPAPAEEKTAGGIIIPDTAKEKPLQGEVLAVGNGTKDEEMVLKAGDTVLYGKYAGTEVEFDGEKYLIMRQSDVLAVMA